MNFEEKNIWKKCEKCGLLQHPSHLRCLACKSYSFTLIEALGHCKLITYTILKALPAEFQDKKSYALGVVVFENGIKVLGQLTTSNDLKIGMTLKPIYMKVCENLDGKELYNFIFEPNR
jgi:uncharacterized OB-fold protein